MTDQRKKDLVFQLGMLLNRVATLSDDETFKKIASTLDAVQDVCKELIDAIPVEETA